MDGATKAVWLQPPWWRAWWFCAFVAGVAVALVRMVWRWRVLQLVHRQRELERAVAERTQELF